jgi:hypothetical protein
MKDAMYPYPTQASTYSLDENKFKELYNDGKNSKIYKLVYDKKMLLSRFGIE